MQQTSQSDYSLLQYVKGSVSGNYNIVSNISSSKPYLNALISLLASALLSFLALIAVVYVQYKTFVGFGIASLDVSPEVAAELPDNFSLFLGVQAPVLSLALAAAIGVWFLFAFISYFVAKIQRGQACLVDVLLFNCFLIVLLPAFLFFIALLISGLAVGIYVSIAANFILLLICLRAEYKGIKTLHSLNSGRAGMTVLISFLVLSAVFGLIYLFLMG